MLFLHVVRIASFFTHMDISSKRGDFLECLIMLVTKSLMVATDLANEIERLSSSSDIGG